MFILRITLHAFAWQRGRLGSFPAPTPSNNRSVTFVGTFCYLFVAEQAERSQFFSYLFEILSVSKRPAFFSGTSS